MHLVSLTRRLDVQGALLLQYRYNILDRGREALTQQGFPNLENEIQLRENTALRDADKDNMYTTCIVGRTLDLLNVLKNGYRNMIATWTRHGVSTPRKRHRDRPEASSDSLSCPRYVHHTHVLPEPFHGREDDVVWMSALRWSSSHEEL